MSSPQPEVDPVDFEAEDEWMAFLHGGTLPETDEEDVTPES